ncbi:MAG: hypothetical protein V1932_09040 [Chloroflexota bacterium]
MTMWKLKSCPRCKGDIFINKDLDGRWYLQCLQCSYLRELKSLDEFEAELAQKGKELAKSEEKAIQ